MDLRPPIFFAILQWLAELNTGRRNEGSELFVWLGTGEPVISDHERRYACDA